MRIGIGTQDFLPPRLIPLPCSPETGASRRKDAEGPRVLPQRSEEQGDEKLENYSLRVAPEPARA